MRASRLVSMLLLLQSRGRMTAAALAEELEVSVRTVYRDLQALGEAGVPVYTEAGPGGGARLVDGYRTRLTGLTTTEAETLFLSGMPGPAAELGLGTVLAAARLKVLAALPLELRSRATRVAERFHLDAPGWFRHGDEVPHLAPLAGAVWDDRRVRVRYRRGDGTVGRTLDPLGLVLKGGVWYLVARNRGQARTYRVSRMAELTVTDDHFDRPESFDLAEHWAAASLDFEASVLRIEVEARLSPAGLRFLSHTAEPAVREAALASVGEPGPDGWVPVTIPAESEGHAHLMVVALGADAEVLGPPGVRRLMTETARTMAAHYEAQDSRDT